MNNPLNKGTNYYINPRQAHYLTMEMYGEIPINKIWTKQHPSSKDVEDLYQRGLVDGCLDITLKGVWALFMFDQISCHPCYRE
jgi:hypothetical protein